MHRCVSRGRDVRCWLLSHLLRCLHQVAVLEERERLVTASAKERAEAVAELRTALDQRAEEIAQLRATAAKEREELVASAKAEYYRGRSDTVSKWRGVTTARVAWCLTPCVHACSGSSRRSGRPR